MSNKENWTDLCLGDLADGFRGVSYQPGHLLSEQTDQSVTLLRATNIQNGRLDFSDVQIVPQSIVKQSQKMKTGDIAVCMSNGSKRLVGKSAQFNGEHSAEYTVGAFCAIFRPKPNSDQAFVKQLFESEAFQAHIDISLAGSAINNLKNSDVESVPFCVPPKPTQSKIATILQTIDNAIAQTEALIEKYSLVKAGMMHDLFTRGLTPDGKLRPPREEASDLYKETPIGWIPTEWEQPELQDVCGHLITYGIVQAGPDIEGGVPYIRTGDMSGESLVKDKMLRTSRKIANAFKRSEVKTGEIVCAIRATVGKVLIVPEELDGANLTQGTARIAPKDDVENRFVAWGFRSSAVQKSIMLCIKGTTFNEITLGDLRELPFSIPTTEHEQRLIADRLDQCQHLVDAERSKLAKLLKEKKGLMHDLLTGEVLVKVDDPEAAHV